jgi:hypothetical protein
MQHISDFQYLLFIESRELFLKCPDVQWIYEPLLREQEGFFVAIYLVRLIKKSMSNIKTGTTMIPGEQTLCN